MRLGFDRGVGAGLVLLSVMIVGTALISYANTRRVWDDADRIDHSRQVIDAVGAVQIDTRRMQADHRAYLVTGYADRIAPYEASAARLRATAAQLAELTASDPEQGARAADAAREIGDGIASLDGVAKLRGGPDGHAAVLALARERGGKSFVDPLLATLAEMDRVERERLAERERAAHVAYRRSIFYAVAGAALGLTAVAMFVAVLARSSRARLRDAARLAEQRELLSATLTSIGDAVIATDVAGNVTFLNPVAVRLTGWSEAEARGVPLARVFNIVNESTREPVDNPALRALREGVIVGLANHTILIARGGTEVPIDDSAAPIRTGGVVSGAVLVFRDITEKKRDEEALRKSEEQRRLALDGAELGAWHFDPATRMLATDARFRTIFGSTAHRLSFDEAVELVHEVDRDRVRDAIADATRPTDPVPYAVEYRIVHPGGAVRWVYAKGRATYAGAPPRLVSFDGTVADVTDRKAAEEEVRKARDRSAAAMQAGEVGTYYWDIAADRVTGDRNFAAIFGVLADDRRAAPIGDFLTAIHPGDRERVGAEIRRTLDTGTPFRSEYRVTGPAGERWLLARGVVERAAGAAVGWAGVVVDITDRRRAEEALAASRARLDYAARASQIGFWYCDLPFDVLEWDDRVKAHFWLPPEARVTIDTFYDRIHPDDREPTRTAIERSVTGRTGYDVHYRTVDPVTRAEKWVRAIGGTDYDETGTPKRFDGVTLDVTDQRRAEAAVRESNDRFRIVARATNDAVWDWDMRTDGVWWNEGVTALFGHPPGAVGPDAAWWYEQIHPEDRERVVTGIHAVIDHGGANWSDEYRFRRADGSYAAVLDRGHAIHEGGKTIRLVGAMQDVTDRKQAEERLRASEERLRVAVAAAKLGQWTLDLRSGVMSCSDGCKANYGRAPADPLTYEELWAVAHPEDVARVQAAVRTAIESRTDYDTEYRAVWPDGSTHWVLVRGRAAYAPDGSPTVMTGVTLDITDRKRAEEREQRAAREAVAAAQAVRFLADASASLAELTDYESTLQRIAGLAVGRFADWCVVDVLDEDGNRRRLAVNGVGGAERASPGAVETAVGVPHVLRTGEPEVVPDVAALDPATAHQGVDRIGRLRGWGIESYLAVPLVSRGRVIGGITFLSASPLRRYGPEELLVATELAVRVTTAIENAALYRTLQEQDRRKDEFLATLAHELRNPLAPVRNGVQILRAVLPDDARAGRTLGMMDRQLGHMVHMIDDLMDVARVSSGKMALRKDRVDLQAVITGAVETSRQAIEAGGHELALSVPPEPMVLSADRTRLSQVLSNLLNNAAKYTPNGGRIELSAERSGAAAVVRVSDTGVGIPAEMLPKIFDMFTQVGASLDRAQGGLGIGLTLVKRLVEMHGGTVAARSAGAGAGSEFTVRLPLANEAPAAPATGGTTGNEPASTKLSVLVVDDNRDAADSLAEILQFKGHEVKTAHDGPEALRTLEAYRPHLIILDIGLPGMSGYEVAKRVRESEKLKGVTLAALTGWGQEEDRRRTKEVGFDYHLVKPADAAAIEQILRTISLRLGG